jgi:hypothetical protein
VDNWIQILKLDQVNVGSTTLDTRELPGEDCCELAKEVYGESFKKYWGLNPGLDPNDMGSMFEEPYPSWLDEIPCEEFYNDLVELQKKRAIFLVFPYYRKALEAWEECKNA